MVDADAYIPEKGYIGAEGVDAPDIVAAFAKKAQELRDQQLPVSGDFSTGWLDSTSCCRILARVAGIPKPRGWYDPEQVKQLFENANWPDFDKLKRGTEPWDCSEYSDHVVAKALVDLCLQYRLQIRFD